MNERSQLRTAIKTALVGQTLAADRVFTRRSKPFRQAELPCLNVYFSDEVVGENSARTAPRRLERSATLCVDYFTAKADEGELDDELDAACYQEDPGAPGQPHPTMPGIEGVVDGRQWAAALGSVQVRDCILASTEVGIVINGNLPMGCVHLEFTLSYRTATRAAPPTDKFNEVDLRVTTGTQVHQNVLTGINQEVP